MRRCNYRCGEITDIPTETSKFSIFSADSVNEHSTCCLLLVPAFKWNALSNQSNSISKAISG